MTYKAAVSFAEKAGMKHTRDGVFCSSAVSQTNDKREKEQNSPPLLYYRKIQERDNKRIAEIVRTNLKKHNLDIPGTAYFDPELNSLSVYYNAKPEKRMYIIALDEEEQIIGGVGFTEYDAFEKCAELQKLYLDDAAKGQGYGKQLIERIESLAKASGYERIYLETHTNLDTAIRLYEKMGYQLIERPAAAVHGTMNRFYMKELLR